MSRLLWVSGCLGSHWRLLSSVIFCSKYETSNRHPKLGKFGPSGPQKTWGSHGLARGLDPWGNLQGTIRNSEDPVGYTRDGLMARWLVGS